MCTPEFVGVCGEFIKSTGGKSNVINNKCMKKIFDDCGLGAKSMGITSTDLDINFSKGMAKCPGAKAKGGLTAEQMHQYILCDDLAKKHAKKAGCSEDDAGKALMEKVACGCPKGHGTTKQSKTGGVDKMTDASQYTGAHKERFGADGKGKGLEGREDKVDDSGYVGAYKGEGTHK